MNLALKKLKAYSKLGLVVAVALVIAVVVIKNRNHEVTFWFFHTYPSVNVLWLLVCTAAASVFSYWVFRTVFSLWRDMRALGREAQMREIETRQKERELELAEQERRIDDKRSDLIRDES